MAEIIKGADVAAEIRGRMIDVIEKHGLKPCLGVVRVGADESDLAYERGIAKTCEKVGITLRVFELPGDIGQEAFDERFREINADAGLHGILLFRPLPKGLSDRNAAVLIDPEKDMDCMSPSNWAKLVMGDEDGYYPCTAESVIRICDYSGVSYDGAKAVVLGRSQVIGKPVGLMLLKKNVTLTWCHSKTKDIAAQCVGAQILVSACGVADMVTEQIASQIDPQCVAVDVGVNFKDGNMCGDFDFEAVNQYAGRLTPVPGGVGAVTNTILASHVIRAAYKRAYGTDIMI